MKKIVIYVMGVAFYAIGWLLGGYVYFYLKEIAFVCVMYQCIGIGVNIFGGDMFSVIINFLLIVLGEMIPEEYVWLYRVIIAILLSTLFLTGTYTAGNAEAKISVMEKSVGDICEAKDMPYWNPNIHYLNPYGAEISISDIHGKIEIINIQWNDEMSFSYKICNFPTYITMEWWHKKKDFESVTFTVRPLEEDKITIQAVDPLIHISTNSEKNQLYKMNSNLVLGRIQYKKDSEKKIVEQDVRDSVYTIPVEKGDVYRILCDRDLNEGGEWEIVNAGETKYCFCYGDGIYLSESKLKELLAQAFPSRHDVKLAGIKFCLKNPEIQWGKPETSENYHLDDGKFWVKCGKNVVYSCYLKGEDVWSSCYMADLLGQRDGEDVKIQWSRADREAAWVEVEVTFE